MRTLLVLVAVPVLAIAQVRQFTAADYAQAEKFMGYNTNSLVYRGPVRPTFLSDGRFYYRNTIADGAEFILVDPGRGTKARAFDHEKLAAALASASGTKVEASKLPFTTFELAGNEITFTT